MKVEAFLKLGVLLEILPRCVYVVTCYTNRKSFKDCKNVQLN